MHHHLSIFKSCFLGLIVLSVSTVSFAEGKSAKKDPTPPTIRGFLDRVDSDSGTAYGWALDTDQQGESISVKFGVDNPTAHIGTTKADSPRQDLQAAGFTSVTHGFKYEIPKKFRNGKPHKLYAFAVKKNGGKTKLVELGTSPKEFILFDKKK